MRPHDDLNQLLKKLRLSGLLATLELRLRQATEDDLPHLEFLVRLLQDEVDRRDTVQVDQRVRRAGFDKLCSLEDFDFQFNPEVPKAQFLDLATCQFVARRENVLLIGHGCGSIATSRNLIIPDGLGNLMSEGTALLVGHFGPSGGRDGASSRASGQTTV